MRVRSGFAAAWPMIGAWLLLGAVAAGYAALCCLALWAVGRLWLPWLPWWPGLLPLAGSLAAGMVERRPLPDEVTGGAEADRASEPRLHAVLDRLCALSGQERPEVRVFASAAPNSLVSDHRGERPVLYVSRGLLDTLDAPRLEAVVAHELAHIAHRDSRVFSVAAGMITWIVLVPGYLFTALGHLDLPFAGLGRLCGRAWEPMFDSGAWKQKPPPVRRVPAPLVPAVLLVAVLGRIAVWTLTLTVALVGMVGAILLALPGFAAVGRLGRRRELAADRAAAALTGSPATLAAALSTVQGGMDAIPETDLRALSPASVLAVVPFDRPDPEQGRLGRLLDWAGRTHPPTPERIARLEAISRGSAGAPRGPR
ncbi:M48 family metalloprotease [Nocardiopsis composta]|uniref:Heat shock protein HtpX n=1 Tax=Nocardiopsis composta TaxID=157465 RepID=A0A7W8QMR1_9ACTN|nr:M48 family metalloprotease [Nocardiopsis composta]MBB5433337.1 heat shock protein HtpX [Nocardiopsis composta]